MMSNSETQTNKRFWNRNVFSRKLTKSIVLFFNSIFDLTKKKYDQHIPTTQNIRNNERCRPSSNSGRSCVPTCLNMYEHVKTYSLYKFFVCARKSYSTSELICLLLLLSLYEWMWNVAMVNVRPVHTRLYINISSRRFEMCLGR